MLNGCAIKRDALVIKGRTFQPYDFGAEKNLIKYGQTKPPAYDLSKVTCPVYIFWGRKDKASAPEVINVKKEKLIAIK